MDVRWADSIHHPDLSPFIRLRKANVIEMYGHGFFVGETFKIVSKMFRKGVQVKSVLTTPQWWEKLAPIVEASGQSPLVYCTEEKEMRSIVGFNLHQGLMAVGERPKDVELHELDDLVLMAEGVSNPENIGSLARLAPALGHHSMVVNESSADPFLRRCVRVSMGNVFDLKIRNLEVPELVTLKDLGYTIYGSIVEGGEDPRKISFSPRSVLLIGNEVNGLSEETQKACDTLLTIPTTGENPALNASHSAAILMNEVFQETRRSLGH